MIPAVVQVASSLCHSLQLRCMNEQNTKPLRHKEKTQSTLNLCALSAFFVSSW